MILLLNQYLEEIQKLILQTTYFPLPSSETRLLVHLYIKNATSVEKAIKLPDDPMIAKLVEQGQLVRSGEQFYLSDETERINRSYLSGSSLSLP